jgi:SAM-dependent methyltransferase
MPAPAWKKLARTIAWPLMLAYPDEARRIVQAPMLTSLIDRTALASARGLTILNAGAGEGSFSPLLLALPGAARVVEMDYGYRSSALDTSDNRQHAVAASLTEIPLKSASVDLVLCSEVLEHIVDDQSALDELRRVLAPGGWLLISVPTPPAVYDHSHAREGYASADLTRMLCDRGLAIVEVAYCMYGAFKLVLRGWNRFGRMPRGLIRTLATVDRIWHIGTPMDLVVLSQLSDATRR